VVDGEILIAMLSYRGEQLLLTWLDVVLDIISALSLLRFFRLYSAPNRGFFLPGLAR
jgi:hypothetical protein